MDIEPVLEGRDRERLDELFAGESRRKLIDFAARIVGSADAEDVVQVTHFALSRLKPTAWWRGEKNATLETWVFTLLKRKARRRRDKDRREVTSDAYRREQARLSGDCAIRHKRIKSVEELSYTPAPIYDNSHDLKFFLSFLSADHRRAVEAHREHGNYAEAARAIGVRISTFRPRLHRAMKKLEQIGEWDSEGRTKEEIEQLLKTRKKRVTSRQPRPGLELPKAA